jgi:hypothetical protein
LLYFLLFSSHSAYSGKDHNLKYAVALLSRHSAVCMYLRATSGLYIFIVTCRVTFSRRLVLIILVAINPLIFSCTYGLSRLLPCGEYPRGMESKKYLTVTDNLLRYLSGLCLYTAML